MEQKFISAILLKTRFGTSDIAVGLGFYGDCSIYKELPLSTEITDYEKYKDPSWTLQPIQQDTTKDTKSNKSITLTL